jgi:hypothetical protein
MVIRHMLIVIMKGGMRKMMVSIGMVTRMRIRKKVNVAMAIMSLSEGTVIMKVKNAMAIMSLSVDMAIMKVKNAMVTMKVKNAMVTMKVKDAMAIMRVNDGTVIMKVNDGTVTMKVNDAMVIMSLNVDMAIMKVKDVMAIMRVKDVMATIIMSAAMAMTSVAMGIMMIGVGMVMRSLGMVTRRSRTIVSTTVPTAIIGDTAGTDTNIGTIGKTANIERAVTANIGKAIEMRGVKGVKGIIDTIGVNIAKGITDDTTIGAIEKAIRIGILTGVRVSAMISTVTVMIMSGGTEMTSEARVRAPVM